MKEDKRKDFHVLFSSLLSGLIVTLITNPLDVIKVRSQKEKTEFGVLKTKPLKTLGHIVREEGLITLFNGAKYSAIINCTGNAVFFIIYERIKQLVGNFIKNPLLLPVASSITARSVTTSITFPLEYWKTRLQGQIGPFGKVKLDYKFMFSAYLATLERDTVFSVTFWIIVENFRAFLHSKEYFANLEKNKKSLLLTNFCSGFVAGIFAASFSIPLDVVKTRKQVYPETLYNVSTLRILKEICEKEGWRTLITGLEPRIVKASFGGALSITLYENMLDYLKKREMNYLAELNV